jgi:hypothetical protein
MNRIIATQIRSHWLNQILLSERRKRKYHLKNQVYLMIYNLEIIFPTNKRSKEDDGEEEKKQR